MKVISELGILNLIVVYNISIIVLWYISMSSWYRYVEVVIVKIRECGIMFVEKIIIIIDIFYCVYWIFFYLWV